MEIIAGKPILQWSKININGSSLLNVCFWEFLETKMELTVPELFYKAN